MRTSLSWRWHISSISPGMGGCLRFTLFGFVFVFLMQYSTASDCLIILTISAMHHSRFLVCICIVLFFIHSISFVELVHRLSWLLLLLFSIHVWLAMATLFFLPVNYVWTLLSSVFLLLHVLTIHVWLRMEWCVILFLATNAVTTLSAPFLPRSD